VMAGGAIDLDELARPKILDPCCVEGQHRASRVPVMFQHQSSLSRLDNSQRRCGTGAVADRVADGHPETLSRNKAVAVLRFRHTSET
jgi:hypothetical protein